MLCPDDRPPAARQTGLTDRDYRATERETRRALTQIELQRQKRINSPTAPASPGELRLLDRQKRAIQSQRAINEIMKPLTYP